MNPDPFRQRGAGPGGRRLVLQVIGMQRSGNHAIINWLSSLFPRAAHFNDLPHDYFGGGEGGNLGGILAGREDCLIFSFEDSTGRSNQRGDLVARVDPVDPAALPGFDVRSLYILRDPYNCWASRVKAREGGRLTSSSRLEDFLRDWTALARLCRDARESFVLYNDWFASEAYRRQVCDRLGGVYSEKTLGEVRGEGGGSSFDGYVRPSYGTILKRLDYYASPQFRRRFLKAPGAYLGRLFAPGLDGRQLKVESRWQHVRGRPGSAPLFADPEVAALSREIFGFSIDPAGRVETAAPRAAAG